MQVVDIPAVTPPYDTALCSALARGGADVELVTSVPAEGGSLWPDGYRLSERFHRLSSSLDADLAGSGSPFRRNGRRAVKLLERVPDMLAYGLHARRADVVHYQWLGLEEIAAWTLPPKRPRVFTAHDIVPREARRRQPAAFRRIVSRMDAVVVHSEHGAARLEHELHVPASRIHVIEMGTFTQLASADVAGRLPPELPKTDAPVVLFFGFVSAYKGIFDLLEAFTDIHGAELWIVGLQRVPAARIDELARRSSCPVRTVPRFVSDGELAACFRRADIVALPYRQIDQSAVLYTALAFGKPLVVARVGGLTEVADKGAAEAVPPGDVGALRHALQALIDSPERRETLAAAATRAADRYSWHETARKTLDLYGTLM